VGLCWLAGVTTLSDGFGTLGAASLPQLMVPPAFRVRIFFKGNGVCLWAVLELMLLLLRRTACIEMAVSTMAVVMFSFPVLFHCFFHLLHTLRTWSGLSLPPLHLLR